MSQAVSTLRTLGIANTIRHKSAAFRDHGDVVLPVITEDSGPQNLKNFPQFVDNTTAVYRSCSSWLGLDDFTLCLGGECSIIIGTMTGFKKNFGGTPGLLWMDAHGDFNTPDTSPSGYIGGMCLAMTCGRGPQLSEEIEKSRPLVYEENVIHLGSRSLDPPEARTMNDSALELYSASRIRDEGIEDTALRVADILKSRCDWIVCHLDLDVIDPRKIPAVNFPDKGEALALEDVVKVIKALRSTGRLKVLNLAGYNPMLDNYNYECGLKILNLISNALS